ncbi:plasmid mobilization protein [Haloarcula argentinensis]|uniref:plasmid mobilization protein n=1 Tax=Haloarcula argentinensis TaxID=43776 RepID=UPI0002B1AEB5|nr:hypothetical protein [Haloarcula argentinensis]EMA25709.1 ribbon-helix-helix protein [Haloarcula argentinensis DSM 12282]
MSEKVTIRLSAEQRKEIVKQANKAGEGVSEYILKATERRISRELQEQRAGELNLGSELEYIADAVVEDVEEATNVDTDQELFYSVALWDLISSEFPAERRATAMEEATGKLEEEVERIRNKEGQE